MIYLDTNVIINSIIDNPKKSESKNLFLKYSEDYRLASSHILVQEVSYILAKYKSDNDFIRKTTLMLSDLIPTYNVHDFSSRSVELAHKIGFSYINDCIHLAVAENFCSEFFTYDKDFEKLKPLTRIKINIL